MKVSDRVTGRLQVTRFVDGLPSITTVDINVQLTLRIYGVYCTVDSQRIENTQLIKDITNVVEGLSHHYDSNVVLYIFESTYTYTLLCNLLEVGEDARIFAIGKLYDV